MTDLQLILIIVGCLASLWQIMFMAWGIKVATGEHKVTIPLWPGLIAVVLFIAAVLV